MAETINDTELRLAQFISETYPDADVAPGGVLRELLIKLSATIQNPITNDMDDLGQANSISKALASAVDTTDPIIDQIASNYNTTRSEGQKSTGKIKVTVATSSSFYIREGFTFVQPVLNLNYLVMQEYSVTPNPSGDELPLISSNGTFYFILPVEAENGGAEYQVTDQTAFDIADGEVIRDFSEAKAYGNFTSGQAIETDKELLARIDTSLANKTLLTPSSITSRLKTEFTNFKDVSLTGANDAEMTRSKRNLFGISTLGMVDVYLRTSNGVETVTITKTATKEDDGKWHLSLDYQDVPGFYRVISIVPTGESVSGSLLTEQTFNFSIANFDVVNNVTTVEEARFSKYQTCDVEFEYQDPNNATTAEFDLLISYQPDIGTIQDMFLSGEERIACADYLVRAALPCYVSVSLKIHRKSTTTELPVDQIKQDIYNYINSLKFGEDLYASEIVDICHNYDIKYVEMPITLTGEVYTTKSTILPLSNSDVLRIPSKPSLGVSKKTTIFITDYFRSSDDNRMSDAISIDVL